MNSFNIKFHSLLDNKFHEIFLDKGKIEKDRIGPRRRGKFIQNFYTDCFP